MIKDIPYHTLATDILQKYATYGGWDRKDLAGTYIDHMNTLDWSTIEDHLSRQITDSRP